MKINKYKSLKNTIKEIIQDLEEHPQSWTHSHTTTTCYGCENSVLTPHTTEWVTNPAPGGINYCQDPVDPTPIQSNWWADDQQWVLDNICAYQTTTCSSLQTPIASNFQANVQAHGWETTFECLIEDSNNPCALIRKKLKRWTDKLANINPGQTTIINRLNDRTTFANNLYTTTYDCGLSPNQDTTLAGGNFNFDPTAWEATFEAIISNAGNPCNVLQNKIDGWQDKLNNISGWSVSHKEMLEHKITFAQNLQTTNNC